MSAGAPLEESAEELYEDAPCGYVSCAADGTILRVNRTFEAWTGRRREDLLGTRFRDLLTGAGRIYHETHLAPLLRMTGAAREIALDVVAAGGERLPALVTAVQRPDADGRPGTARMTIFDASDRRRYEQELLRSRRREQEIARELQRSLLAGTATGSGAVAIDVLYRPAVAGLEVGGDWHDAFWLDERRVALVVGDVVGRGIAAATDMGQLRSAIRALASTGLTPGPLLDALDRFAARHGVGRMSTLVYAELDVEARELRHSAAGHPPPLLAGADGDARYAEGGRSVPIDAVASAAPRPEASAALAPGTRVLLYTDGLVERRERPLGAGLAALRDEVVRAGDALSLPALARRLEPPGEADDVCLLSARLAPAR